MCGICGILRFDGQSVDPAALDRLTDAIAHRGPDGRGTFIDDSVGLGHRRLSIIDLSEAATQPMKSADGNVVLTFNGEIYNFRELRKELEARGRHVRSTGDTEVLLQLYEEFGEACIPKLRGMFAFGIYDRKRQKVLLVRDRLGKKPLKYFTDGKVFAFASELKALRTLSECPREIDPEAIHHFLTMMYVPSPGTGFRGIKKLPAAHLMSIDLRTGKQEIKRYWELSYSTDTSKSLLDFERDIRSTFEESVRLRMVADVPVGAFLSGGIDSAAVVAAMAGISDKPVETFSIGTAQQTHNELPYAQLVAERYGTNHHPIVVEPDIMHLLPELVHTYEEPYADPSVTPTYLLARETRKSVTVALNGDGGDENFAGYARYPILKFSRMWSSVPFVHHAVLPLVRLFHSMAGSTLSYRSLRFQESILRPIAERQLQYLSFFTEAEKQSLYRSDVSFPDTFQEYAKRTMAARGRSPDWLHQAMSADIDTYLADDLLPKVDLGTMAHGLEARSPFLDHKLLELSATLPSAYALRGYNPKWILKKIIRGTVPDAIIDKRKTGFRLPLDHWFRHELKSFVENRLLDKASPLGILFDPAGIERFLRGYQQSRVDQSDHIWALLWLDEWMRQYM